MNTHEQVKKPENAIVYVRLSDTVDDATGKLSLADQDAKARKRGADLGWTIARTVTENDMNGTGRRSMASAYKTRKVVHPDGRVTFEDPCPRWREVLAELCTGQGDGLIVLDLDRALRQMRSATDLLDMHRASGCPVESATGSLRLYGPEDYDMVNITAWAAAKSSADTARRVKAARARQRDAGTNGGGTRPYGWAPVEGKPGQLALVPAERDAVQFMAEAVLTGRSLHSIARELNERGVTPVKGGTWIPETVRSTLLRERNTGTIDGKPATWPAILDPDIYDQVVAILTSPVRRTSPGSKGKWLGAGIYLCGVCGAFLYSRHESYVCKAGHVKISREGTDREVVARVVLRMARPDAADLLAPPEGNAPDLAALAHEAAKLRQRKAMLAGMFAAGEMDTAEWKAASTVLKDKLAALDAKLNAAAAVSAQAPAAGLAGHADAEALWQGMDLETQRKVLRSLVSVTVTRQGRGARPPGWHRGDVAGHGQNDGGFEKRVTPAETGSH